MNDNLDQLSDQELSEVFAVEVAGWSELQDSTPWEFTDPPEERVVRCGRVQATGPHDQQWAPMPPFATDANAVLPWLEKYEWSWIEWSHLFDDPDRRGGHRMRLGNHRPSDFLGCTPFAKAACIALIRAKRAGK